MTPSIISSLQETLGSNKIITGEAVRQRYCHIWRMHDPLQARAVILPQNTSDVAAALKICNDHHQPIVVHGGLTNMVGSTETNADEVVISLERMNGIEEIDTVSRTITVQAGVILEHVQAAARENDLLFPLNFGAKGSAQMGGVISTNAGGLRVFRYGMTRNLVLGLEAVMADGTVVSSMKKIIKDNSAYDLKQLFVGSEGTLGVITRAVLKLVEAPKSRTSAFVALDEYEKVIAFLKFMDAGLAGTLSGFELIWNATYQAMTSPPATVPPPLPYDYKYYVLLETLGSDQEKDQSRLLQLLETALEQGLVLEAAPAQSGSDLDWFWKIREDVGVVVDRCNNDQHFDISLPIPYIGDFVDNVMRDLDRIPGVEKVFPFGHAADGNIHFIIGKQSPDPALVNQINEVIYAPLQAVGGSISAEHGIGVDKKSYLHLTRKPEEMRLMKTLKQALDPRNILNRGKVVG